MKITTTSIVTSTITFMAVINKKTSGTNKAEILRGVDPKHSAGTDPISLSPNNLESQSSE